MRSAASNQSINDYLLSFDDGKEIDEIVSECGTVDELSDDVVARIYENCDNECQDLQRKVSNDLHELIMADTIISLESEKKADQVIKELTTFSEAITLLAEIPQQFREASDPEALIASSKLKIDSALSDKLISESQAAQMKEQVEKSFKFDPLWTTSYEEILLNVKKGAYFLKLHLFCLLYRVSHSEECKVNQL